MLGIMKRRKIIDKEQIVDRLSQLPESVILHILSLMDTKDAVQMCLLSKKWIHLWTHLPSLHFNGSSFKDMNSFKKFVLCIISQRKARNISSLTFCHRSKDKAFMANVMTYALSHGVEEADINNEDCFISWSFPFQSLRRLKMQDCEIHHDRFLEYPMFESLTTLHLRNISLVIHNQSPEIFSSCVNLEELFMIDCDFGYVGRVVKISCPRLVNLSMFHISLSPRHFRGCELIISAPRLFLLNYETGPGEYPALLSVNGCPLLSTVALCLPSYISSNCIKENHFTSHLTALYEKSIRTIINDTKSLKLELACCKILFLKSNSLASIEIHNAEGNEKILLTWKLDRSEGEELIINKSFYDRLGLPDRSKGEEFIVNKSLLNRLGLLDIFGRVGFILCPHIFLTLHSSRKKLANSFQGLFDEIFRDVNQKELENCVFSAELTAIRAGLQLAWDRAFVHIKLEKSLLAIFKSQTENTSSVQDGMPFAVLKSVLSRNWECNVTHTLHDKIVGQMQWPN